MAAPSPDFAFYSGEHMGAADEAAFARALPLAMARLAALAGTEVPERHADAYRHAACALADRAAGVDASGTLVSEMVGDTSLTYSESVRAATDYDAALPWLAGTGLLCRAVGAPRV